MIILENLKSLGARRYYKEYIMDKKLVEAQMTRVKIL